MRLSRPDHNPNRKGGKNLWTDEEMQTLEGGFEDLVTRLPGRTEVAVANRMLRIAKERALGAETEIEDICE